MSDTPKLLLEQWLAEYLKTSPPAWRRGHSARDEVTALRVENAQLRRQLARLQAQVKENHHDATL